MGLREKVIHGLGWCFADNIVNHGLRFLIGLVLARLIGPYEYGLIGIAMIFVSVFENIVDGGFSYALIQKEDPIEEDYSTVFVINMSISVILYLLIFLFSPFIANFFNYEAEIITIVRILALLLIVDALMLVPKAKLVKALEFKIQTKISLLSSVSAGVVGLTMALCGMGVWALVGQMITRHSCNSCCLLVASRQIPSLHFSFKSFHSLFSYGSKLLISDIINSTYNQIYRIVVGKCYNASTLGQFTRAMQFSEFFSVTLTQVIQKVSFPSLSKIQSDDEKLKIATSILIKHTSFIDLTCMLSLAAVAKPLVLVLIGDKWLESVVYLQLLCLNMLFLPLHGINLDVIKAKGRSDIFLKLEILKKCFLILPVLAGIFINIYWMLIVNVIIEFVCFLTNSYFSCKLTNYTIVGQIKDIAPSFRIAVIVSLVLYAVSYAHISEFVLFPLEMVVGLFLIIIISEFSKFDVYLEIKQMIMDVYLQKCRKT